jgi:uroporphyrinogen-III synthase
LIAAGWMVTTVVAYRAEPVPVAADLVKDGADAVTFASAATVQRFVTGSGGHLHTLVTKGCRFYAIGPQTAAAVTAAGLTCAGTADEATIDALVALVVRDLGSG